MMKASTLKVATLKIGTGLLASALLMAAISADAAPVLTAPTKKVVSKKKKAVRKTVRKTRVQRSQARPGTAAAMTKPSSAALRKPMPRMLPATTKATSTTTQTPTYFPGTQPTANMQTAVAAPAAPAKPLSLTVGLSRSQSMYDFEDGTLKRSTDFNFEAMIQASEKWKVLVNPSYSRDEITPEESGWGDTFIQASYKAVEGSTLKLTPHIATLLPTSKSSASNAEAIGSLRGALSLGFVEGALPKGVSLGFAVNLTRWWHEFDTNVTGGSNSQWTSRQSASAGYEFAGISLTAIFKHNNTRKYDGTLTDNYTHAEEIGYSVTDNFSMSFGHTMSGPTGTPGGADERATLQNDRDSVLYGGISATF